MKKFLHDMLEQAGVTVDGAAPYDMQILYERVYNKVFWQQSLGLGESYMHGWWECQQLDELAYRVLLAKADRRLESHIKISLKNFWYTLRLLYSSQTNHLVLW